MWDVAVPKLMQQPISRPEEVGSGAQINTSAQGEGKGTRERKESLEQRKDSYLIPSYLGDRGAGASVESRPSIFWGFELSGRGWHMLWGNRLEIRRSTAQVVLITQCS